MAADRRMLGACVHDARVPGDGCLRASAPIVCGIAEAGVPVEVSLHWCDVNVEVCVPMAGAAVSPGDLLPLFSPGDVLVRVGDVPAGLPPIVVGAVAVPVPVGGLGARA
jgi:hypothetical protein